MRKKYILRLGNIGFTLLRDLCKEKLRWDIVFFQAYVIYCKWGKPQLSLGKLLHVTGKQYGSLFWLNYDEVVTWRWLCWRRRCTMFACKRDDEWVRFQLPIYLSIVCVPTTGRKEQRLPSLNTQCLENPIAGNGVS